MDIRHDWRETKDNRDFDNVLKTVQEVTDLGMEVCCTMGMLTAELAHKLPVVRNSRPQRQNSI